MPRDKQKEFWNILITCDGQGALRKIDALRQLIQAAKEEGP